MNFPAIAFLGAACLMASPAMAESAAWIETDGLLVMEAEKGTPETADTWKVRTDVEDYVGEGFIRWEGSDYLNNKSHGVMVYRFIITTPGRYRLFLRSFHDPASRGKRPDEENDCWTNSQLNSTTQYLKTFRNAVLAGTDWSYRTQWVFPEENFVDAYYDIPAGRHEFRIAARAAYFMVDRIFLAKDTATIDEYAPESPREGGTTYAMWLQEHFSPEDLGNPEKENSLWGKTADPDRDGLANALECYTGADPLVSDAGSVYSSTLDGNGLRLQLRRELRTGGFSLGLETSADLSDWLPQDGLLIEEIHAGEVWIRATVPEPDGDWFRFTLR